MTLGLTREPRQHWFDHKPRLNEVCDGPIKLAKDILNGDFFESQSERIISMCGVCGHWIHAVHGEWFDAYDKEIEKSAFADHMRESVCPECGCVSFRSGIVLATLTDAQNIRAKHDVTRYVLNRADDCIWSGGMENGPDVDGLETRHVLESALYEHGPYYARCPACGFAEKYGGYQREFDFHHWDYQNEVGCYLCRECHTHIHDEMRANEQTEETGREWQYDAVRRLLGLSGKNNLCFGSSHEFMSRFNIPEGGVAHSAVDESLLTVNDE
jgi:hypothetical protein